MTHCADIRFTIKIRDQIWVELVILQKLKTELKKPWYSSHTIALSKGTILTKKNTDFLQKNADISKIKRALVLKGIFSETKYECVLTCQIWGF